MSYPSGTVIRTWRHGGTVSPATLRCAIESYAQVVGHLPTQVVVHPEYEVDTRRSMEQAGYDIPVRCDRTAFCDFQFPPSSNGAAA